MTDLSGVTSIEVPRAVVQAGHAHLRRVGMEGLEGFVLWIGVQDGEVFRVQEPVIPQQSVLATRTVSVWLFRATSCTA